MQLWKKREPVTDEDFEHELGEVRDLGELSSQVEEMVEDVMDKPETYGVPYDIVDPSDPAAVAAATAEREKLREEVNNFVPLPTFVDYDAPIFRQFRKTLKRGKIDIMLERALAALEAAGDEDHVAQIVMDESGEYHITAVARKDLTPEELESVLEMDYESDPALAKAHAEQLEAAQKLTDDALDAGDAADDAGEVVDESAKESAKESAEDGEVDEVEQDEVIIPADAHTAEWELDDERRMRLIGVGTSQTVFDSDYAPPSYNTRAAQIYYTALRPRRQVYEEAPFLLAARRDIMFARHKYARHLHAATPSPEQIHERAVAQLRKWGAPEPLLPKEVSVIELAMVRMHVDFHSKQLETKQLAAQSAAIYLKYNPVRRGVARATRINPMQECADRLIALLPVRAAPKSSTGWADILTSLLGYTHHAEIISQFAARLASQKPLRPEQLSHWSAQDIFTYRIGEHFWCSINFRACCMLIADINPVYGETYDLPPMRTAVAPITPDWVVALKKVRWPPSETPPRLLE
jgi:hypothetical protein